MRTVAMVDNQHTGTAYDQPRRQQHPNMILGTRVRTEREVFRWVASKDI